MVVATELAHPPGQCPAHGHPVEEFHTLRAGLFDPIVDRVAGQRLRLGYDFVRRLYTISSKSLLVAGAAGIVMVRYS